MSDPLPVPAAQPSISAFQRLLLAFSSPASVFEDIVRKPTVVVVLLALIVSTVCAQLMVVPKLDFETTLRTQFSHSAAPMTEEQQDKAISLVKGLKWVSPAFTVVGFPIQLAILAGIYFLALKLLGSDSKDFVRLFSGIAHATWPPTLVKVVLTTAAALPRAAIDIAEAQHLVKSSLGAFLPANAAPTLVAIADGIDVLEFWRIALVSLALSKIGRVSLAKGAGITIFFWLCMRALLVAVAALQSLGQR